MKNIFIAILSLIFVTSCTKNAEIKPTLNSVTQDAVAPIDLGTVTYSTFRATSSVYNLKGGSWYTLNYSFEDVPDQTGFDIYGVWLTSDNKGNINATGSFVRTDDNLAADLFGGSSWYFKDYVTAKNKHFKHTFKINGNKDLNVQFNYSLVKYSQY